VCICVYVFCISHILHTHSRVNVYRCIPLSCRYVVETVRHSIVGQTTNKRAYSRVHTHTADTAQYNCCHRVQERRARDAFGKTHRYDFIAVAAIALSSPRIATRDSRMRARVGACPRRGTGFARLLKYHVRFARSCPLRIPFSPGCASRRADRWCCTVCDLHRGNRGCWARNCRDFPRVSSSHCGGRLI